MFGEKIDRGHQKLSQAVGGGNKRMSQKAGQWNEGEGREKGRGTLEGQKTKE